MRTLCMVLVFLWSSSLWALPAKNPKAPLKDDQKDELNLKDELGGDSELKNLLEDADSESKKKSKKQTPEGKPVEGRSLVGKISQKLNEYNPRLTMFGDLLYWWSDPKVFNGDGDEVSRRFSFREGEADLRADVDPYAKALMILSFAQERPNQYTLDIEEGYLTLETLPWGLRAKIGRFRTGFGLINKLHKHDLPHTNYPLAVEKFLGGEDGTNNDGIALSYLFPFAPLQATVEVLNSDVMASFPYAKTVGGKLDHSDYPFVIGRLKFFDTVMDNFDLQFGTSYAVGYGNSQENLTSQLFGGDFFFRWRPLKRAIYTSFVFQTEFFYAQRERAIADGGNIYSFGWYAFGQYQFQKNWYIGGRYDYSEDLNNSKLKEYKLSGYVSYYTTEFFRIRVGYEYHQINQNQPDIHSVFIQLTFVFGSHPAEPYWVNR